MKAAITAIGGYVPEYVLTNSELTMVDTNDEWIIPTGIKERRILKPEEGRGASYLAIKAVEAMKKNTAFAWTTLICHPSIRYC